MLKCLALVKWLIDKIVKVDSLCMLTFCIDYNLFKFTVTYGILDVNLCNVIKLKVSRVICLYCSASYLHLSMSGQITG